MATNTTTYRGRPAEEINNALNRLIPETKGCTYADYPMDLGEEWKDGADKTDKGEPCFIKTGDRLPAEGAKIGYLWGPGKYGWGYYHLTTRTSYAIIMARLKDNYVTTGPPSLCPCQQPPLSARLPHLNLGIKDDVRNLIHARWVTKVPSDLDAVHYQIAHAQGGTRALPIQSSHANWCCFCTNYVSLREQRCSQDYSLCFSTLFMEASSMKPFAHHDEILPVEVHFCARSRSSYV